MNSSFIVAGFGPTSSSVSGKTFTVTCTTTSGSNTVTTSGTFAGIQKDAVVVGTGIPAPATWGATPTTVTAVASTSSLTISNKATASGSASLTFTPAYPSLTYSLAYGASSQSLFQTLGAGAGHVPYIQGMTPLATQTFPGISIVTSGTNGGVTTSQSFLSPTEAMEISVVAQIDQSSVVGSPSLTVQLQGTMRKFSTTDADYANVGTGTAVSGASPVIVVENTFNSYPAWRIKVTNSDGSSTGILNFVVASIQ